MAGSIIDKLMYLSDSKDLFIRFMKNLGYEVKDDMTLRKIIKLLNKGYDKLSDNTLKLDLVLVGGVKVIDAISGKDYTEYCEITSDGFTVKTQFFSMDTEEYTLVGYSKYRSDNLKATPIGVPGAMIWSNYYNYYQSNNSLNRIICEPTVMSNHERHLNQCPIRIGQTVISSVSKKSGEKMRTSLSDKIIEIDSTEVFTSYQLPRTCYAVNNLPVYYTELYLYNKYLTEEELLQDIYSYCFDTFNECFGFYDGIKGLGAMYPARQSTEDNEIISFEDNSDTEAKTYIKGGRAYKNDEVVLEPPLASYDFESVHFYNLPDELYLGREECISAFVYPSDISKKFEIEYSTSDDSICDCVGSIFIPKAIGKVTLTAKIRGTNIFTSKEINVVEPPTIKEVIYEVSTPGNITVMTPSDTMTWIQNQVTQAHELGFTVCRFPSKSVFHIVPTSATGYEIPNNMIIDFNYSTIYIDDGHDYVTSNYILFDLNEGQEFSGIRNLILYGERLNNPSNVGYTEGNTWYRIQNCKWCILENVYTRYTCGFDVSLGGYSQFRSTPDFNTKGRVDYTFFQMGKILSDGTVKERDDWITTASKIPAIDKEYTDGTFRMGTYSAQIGVIGARLYNILWYDSEQNPVEYYENCIQNEPYPLKDNFKYFDVTFNSSTLPSKNNTGGDDYCAIRMLQSRSTKLFTIRNFVSLDNYSGAFSVVGQIDRLLVTGLFTFSWEKRKNGWDIDFEDGWLNMRKYVLKNCFARTIYFSGDSGALINSYCRNLVIRSDMNSVKLANSYIMGIDVTPEGGRLCNEIIGVVTKSDIDSFSNSKNYATYVIGTRRSQVTRNGEPVTNSNIFER